LLLPESLWRLAGATLPETARPGESAQSALRLGVGQRFQLQAKPDVQATIEGIPQHYSAATVTRIAGEMLSVQCETNMHLPVRR
jgi:hypothetical protein